MRIVGVDPSLTATGICHPDGSTETLKTRDTGPERLSWLRDAIAQRVAEADVVAIEGYSYGSKGRAVVSIGELGGVLRLWLYEYGPPYVEIPPACLKRYATGRGNASKDDVLQAAVMRSGHVFVDNNAADAWWLWQAALAHYCPDDPRLVGMPKAHLEALRKVMWPELKEVAE